MRYGDFNTITEANDMIDTKVDELLRPRASTVLLRKAQTKGKEDDLDLFVSQDMIEPSIEATQERRKS